jgi:hypothetical protein
MLKLLLKSTKGCPFRPLLLPSGTQIHWASLVLQELKGNIRVFCRVRPLAPSNPDVEAGEDGKPFLQFSTTGKATYHHFKTTGIHETSDGHNVSRTCGIVRPLSMVSNAQWDPNHPCHFSGDLHGRGLEIVGPSNSGQAPSRHNFCFDKVFPPASSQVRCTLVLMVLSICF